MNGNKLCNWTRFGEVNICFVLILILCITRSGQERGHTDKLDRHNYWISHASRVITRSELQCYVVTGEFSKLQPSMLSSSSSSIGTATLVGFGLLNYRWVFSAGRFLQSVIASGTSNPQLGGPVIRTFQLPLPGVPTSETTRANPSSGRWNYGREITENFAESGDFHVTYGFFYMP